MSNKSEWKALGLKTIADVSRSTGLSWQAIHRYKKKLGIKFYDEYKRYLWTSEDVARLLEYRKNARGKQGSRQSGGRVKKPWELLGLKATYDVSKITGMDPALVWYYKRRMEVKFYDEYKRYLWTNEDIARLLEYRKNAKTASSESSKKNIQKKRERMRAHGFMPPPDMMKLLHVSENRMRSYYNNVIFENRKKTGKRKKYSLGVWDRDTIEGLLKFYKIPVPQKLLDDYFSQNKKTDSEKPDTNESGCN